MKTQWLLIIMLFLLCACMAQTPKSGRSVASKSTTVSATPATPTNEPSLYWYTTVSGGTSIIIDQNNTNSISLRGTQIHNYLNITGNSSRLYCLVVSYDVSGVKKQLRARAVPLTATEILTGIQRKYLRIDLPLTSENMSVCTGTVNTYSNISNVAYSMPDLSSTVNTIYTSTSVDLYISNSNSISDATAVPETSLDFSSLYFRINPQSNTTNPNACSNSSCQAKGYDCCLDGQCAIDGTEKSGASSLSTYAQAKADVQINPYRFIYYPEIYYVCPNKPHATPTPTATPDAQATADALLDFLKNEYYCLQGYKDNGTYDACSSSGTNGTEAYYKTVMKDVWNRCGCSADPDGIAPNNAATLCPNYGLKLIKNASGVITRVECDVPVNTQPTPFQNLNISVPARSAPHRFFKTDGSSVDDITTLSSVLPEVLPEGTPFSYLDTINKTTPQSGRFNMNAITGQFSVDLSSALPAKELNVEYDQTYLIFATSGYYTPCPQCAKDSWFSSFSAFPSSQQGVGLQVSSYTTARDSYNNNSTNGNYEDTIFGRACWVPPTMIPFSHQKNENIQSQRLNRLATQSAYYVNGYKRDWYGFNYGALIGSFDGVRWFAIGNGRRVTATSTKLFLAINAPFADLATNSNIVVSITADQPQSTASSYDYDPSLSLTDSRQNLAGTCQAWHQCSTDSDCVTKLGWEYVCADITNYKTTWPSFDANGNEKSDSQTYTFNSILQGMLSTENSKRCVYRGAGAPCKANYTTLSTTEQKKLFTCAPNFYCATVTSDAFNTEVVRTPNLLENILYGQEANVLGRPYYYVGARERLSTPIQSNIKKNASLYVSSDIEQSDFGLCRPGKKIGGTGYTYYHKLAQHQNKDTANRTDYISQISSCDSSKTGVDRVVSCPLIGADGNLVPTESTGYYQLNSTTGFTSVADILKGLQNQNACGYEQRYSTDGVNFTSPFNSIELKPISSAPQIVTPGVVKDACLRRAGSVCHSDLDCSPNKLHAEQAEYFPISFFGKTDAEKNYWSETLTCGQAVESPYPGTTDYASYDMTQNRCCRAPGKDFTMYTQSNSKNLTPSSTDDDISNLVTSRLPQDAPATNGRYSRYSVVNLEDRGNGAASAAYDQTPKVALATTPKEYQWKTIADTGAKTCCGGAWMRKFADGTHDWSVTNRLSLNFENFSCLNYSNELTKIANINNVFVNSKNYYKDYDKLCLSPSDGACAQVPIAQVTSFELAYPQDADASGSTATMNTSQDPSRGPTSANYGHEVPYLPVGFFPSSYTNTGGEGPFNYLKDPINYYATAFYIPSYISVVNILDVSLDYYPKAHTNPINVPLAYVAGCNAATNPFDATFPANSWCVAIDSSGYAVMHVKGDPGWGTNSVGDLGWGGLSLSSTEKAYYHAGVKINFNKMNSANYVWRNIGSGAQYTDLTRVGLTGANALYYLTKLGRLELSGVPQIFYEPIYCNSDRSKMVDGIFNSQATRTGFTGISFAYDPAVNGRSLGQIYDSTVSGTDASTQSSKGGASTPRITFMDKLATNQIFSDNQFTCCLPLGTKTSSGENCCSNSAISDGTSYRCSLPPRTDLNVYFNRFVSGEGVGTSQPGGGLVDDDFIPETGEPKLRDSTYTKLSALGQAYCANKKVRQGGAFGKFFAEPNQGYYTHAATANDRYFSILDSANDYDSTSSSTNDNGYVPFNEGYRWNHHVYCDD